VRLCTSRTVRQLQRPFFTSILLISRFHELILTGPTIALPLTHMTDRITTTPAHPASALPIFFGPDVLSQLLHLRTHRRSKLAVPEKALMFAVLADAVETYQKYAFSTSRRRQFLFREVEEWFWKKETDHLFSFPVICEVLGFDPAFLRLGLLRWTENRGEQRSPRKRTQLHSVRSQARKRLRSPARRVASTRAFSAIPG
jgi:hypothetical protein